VHRAAPAGAEQTTHTTNTYCMGLGQGLSYALGDGGGLLKKSLDSGTPEPLVEAPPQHAYLALWGRGKEGRRRGQWHSLVVCATQELASPVMCCVNGRTS